MRVVDLHDLATDGLAVGDLGLADVRLDLELAPHAVDEDVEVELAHALDDGLAGLLVLLHLEGRVLLGEPSGSRCPGFSWSPFVFGSMATEMTGSGKVIDSSTTWLVGSHRVSPVVVSFRPIIA
ncbi:hypothetical protein GCM10025868_32740 [Angustibacter aerolatus]|uniref:Uncharacterized protein n=1 Tax=Angustibacter aerolatus TaxID=1162965 RepID=A0ABQ6JLM3_9ACTN|nr:hypothetical protein GCM10025868_32740 [Angustibacter aerolatus]